MLMVAILRCGASVYEMRPQTITGRGLSPRQKDSQEQRDVLPGTCSGDRLRGDGELEDSENTEEWELA